MIFLLFPSFVFLVSLFSSFVFSFPPFGRVRVGLLIRYLSQRTIHHLSHQRLACLRSDAVTESAADIRHFKSNSE